MFGACPSPAGGDDTPTVNGVTVSPATATVAKGETRTFSATVTGTGNPAQTVTWTINGNGSDGTWISSAGVLTVDANETAADLTVRAVSTVDTSKSGTAAVTVTGGTGSLTINGLPSGGTRAVYVFSADTNISTYNAITTAYTNGSYQAVGASLSSSSTDTFDLYTWNSGVQGGGFTGQGSLPVLLLNSGGSITDSTNPMYSWATVSFSNGEGTAAFSGFTAVVLGGEPPGGGGRITIIGLPSGGTRAVYVFSSGTDISTYNAITTAYMNGNYQALGASLASSSTDTFTLYTWTGGVQGGGFTGQGSLPVLLLNTGGSTTDSTNPMYSWATVSFSNGEGTAAFSGFTAVVLGGSGSVTYTVTADGSASATTSKIDFVFSEAVTGLSADDITISGTGAADKGILSGSGANWSLPLTVTAAGNVTVSINKSGIESVGKTLTLLKPPPPNGRRLPTANSTISTSGM
jgi:hypothetical protein